MTPICTFPECSRPTLTKKSGLCRGHLAQQKRGLTLKPIGEYRMKYDPVCSFEDCTRSHSSQGLCSTHLAQKNRGRTLTPIGDAFLAARTSLVRDAEGRKKCNKCDQWKNESEFYVHPGTKDGVYSTCKECRAYLVRQTQYSLPAGWVESQLEKTGHRCPICLRDENELVIKNGKTPWVVDHDHSCCPGQSSCGKCVRGLICGPCNRMLGIANDTPEILEGAARYLRDVTANS